MPGSGLADGERGSGAEACQCPGRGGSEECGDAPGRESGICQITDEGVCRVPFDGGRQRQDLGPWIIGLWKVDPKARSEAPTRSR